MFTEDRIPHWEEELSTYLPTLSKPQIAVLALWSFGCVLARTCGLTTVSGLMGKLLNYAQPTMQERLRDWYLEKTAKHGGKKRRELEVSSCFIWLLRWIVAWWPKDQRKLCLVMDATPLSNRFVILCISVVYRSCAIPIAWKVLANDAQADHKGHWLTLFSKLEGALPEEWFVLVMADRGLYSPTLYRKIVEMKWHPFFRINANGKYRQRGHGNQNWEDMSKLSKRVNGQWAGVCDCFKENPLSCTLLIAHDLHYKDPWMIVTDLPVEQANVSWYSLRSWIECGFKDLKRGGWQWQYTRMTDPGRVERIWLVLAVATLLVISLGREEKELGTWSVQERLTQECRRKKRSRKLSCFREGSIQFLICLLKGEEFRQAFYPEPWPDVMKNAMSNGYKPLLELTG